MNKPELCVAVGSLEALSAAKAAGCDAVYVCGKHFRPMPHEDNFAFDDESLKAAAKNAKDDDIRLYVELGECLTEQELPELKDYLRFLAEKVQPAALSVRDLAVLSSLREENISLPLRAAAALDAHNEETFLKLISYGFSSVAVGHELSAAQIAALTQKTGLAVEYTVHGKACVARGGQCLVSSILFNVSANKGRCTMPCRHKYRLADEETGRATAKGDAGQYRLSVKDICLFPHLPELFAAGVASFKIDGRSCSPERIARTVAAYRKATDDYANDPCGYVADEETLALLQKDSPRGTTASFAINAAKINEAINLKGDGEREVFVRAVKEPGLSASALKRKTPPAKKFDSPTLLTVRTADYICAKAAIISGADVVFVGGDQYRPQKPPTLADLAKTIDFAHGHGVKVIVDTPRITDKRDCDALREFLPKAAALGADGVMVGNPGALKIAYDSTVLPIQTDASFNVFNAKAAAFLAEDGATSITASLELNYDSLKGLVENSPIPVEVIIHGANAALISDFDLSPAETTSSVALKDTSDELHPLRRDWRGRIHVLFAKDLCLLPYIDKFFAAASLRIEAKDYSPRLTAITVKAYREALDTKTPDKERFAALLAESRRKFGAGAYRFP